ncbi:MAG TPA: hypothetical protein VFZ03_03865 [Dongiaceae bacterium]
MKTRRTIAVVFAAAMISGASASYADRVKFSVDLPNCPTSLVLSAPPIFEGAENRQDLLDQIAASPMIQGAGTPVLALAAPRKPSIVLFLGERGDVSARQGKVTKAQFEQLKASILATNGQTAMAEVNQRGQDNGRSVNSFGIVGTSSDSTSVTITALMSGSAPGADFASFLGILTSYVHQCIASAIMMAPASNTSSEDFERLMRSTAFE